jgi:hypothetical protein
MDIHCRFEYRLRKIPPASSQRLLTLSLSYLLLFLLFILYCCLFNKWERFPPLGLTLSYEMLIIVYIKLYCMGF